MSDNKPRANVQLYGWDWDRDQERRPQIPWIGVFLLVFGGLLLLERALPAYRDLGNIAVLAAGIAFLIVWAVRRLRVAPPVRARMSTRHRRTESAQSDITDADGSTNQRLARLQGQQ